MRILFVSDTHLGLDLPSRPRVTRRRRGDDFFRNFELALAPALAGEVDVVLHGGDLHYRSRVPAWLAQAALAPLLRVASAGVPVLLVPGNHERSRLPYPLLALHPNLHVFDRPRTVVLEAGGLRVAFAGFPYARAVRSRLPELLAATGHAGQAADLRVLCVHHCVEGATCGPNDFVFRTGDDVIRIADLVPGGFAAVLSGHIHRHQVLRPEGAPPIVYAGSVERTSFAELEEVKGMVLLELTRAAPKVEFRPLPARPMVIRQLVLEGASAELARERIRCALAATPPDAVVQLRLARASPAAAQWLSAAALRELGGARNVSVRIEFPAAPVPRPASRPAGPESSTAQTLLQWGDVAPVTRDSAVAPGGSRAAGRG